MPRTYIQTDKLPEDFFRYPAKYPFTLRPQGAHYWTAHRGCAAQKAVLLDQEHPRPLSSRRYGGDCAGRTSAAYNYVVFLSHIDSFYQATLFFGGNPFNTRSTSSAAFLRTYSSLYTEYQPEWGVMTTRGSEIRRISSGSE